MQKFRNVVYLLMSVALCFSCQCKETSVKIVDSQKIRAYSVDIDQLKYIYEDTIGNSRSVFVQYSNIDPDNYAEVNRIERTDSFHVWIILNLKIEGENSDCNILFENHVNFSSIQLKSNKEIIYHGKIISPNTDIFKSATFFDFIPIVVAEQYVEDELTVILSNDFFRKGIFTQGKHIFKLEFDTDDGIHIEDEIVLDIQ